jgi:predicted permease
VSQDEVITQSSTDEQARGEPPAGLLATLWNAFIQTIASPGFMAMAAGFLTACIPPLQKALFEGGGPLRFLGSAVETLGMASSSISTMVVAASLVQPRRHGDEDIERAPIQNNADAGEFQVVDENPGMTDPNFGPYRRRQRQRSFRFQSLRTSVTRASVGMLKAVPRTSQEMFRLHFWFCASRLVLTPAVTVGIIVALDCSGGGLLDGVPNLAKLVMIVNSALPGALLVIVLLQFDERMAETASVVAKVYMPSYLLSIFTIAAWAAVALWITLPDQDGLTMCRR